MKEVVGGKPSQLRATLTESAKSPRLDKGVIYMAADASAQVEVQQSNADVAKKLKTKFTDDKKSRKQVVDESVKEGQKPVEKSNAKIEAAEKAIATIQNPDIQHYTKELVEAVKRGEVTEEVFAQTIKDMQDLGIITFASEAYEGREAFLQENKVAKGVVKDQLGEYYDQSPRVEAVKLKVPEQPINIPTEFENVFKDTAIQPPKNRDLARFMRSFLSSAGGKSVEQWDGQALLDSYAEFKRIQHKLTESRALVKESNDRKLMHMMEKALNAGLDTKIKKKEITEKQKDEIKKHPEEIKIAEPPAKPDEDTVKENARLDGEERWDKAQEILQSMGVTQPLSEEHRQAVMDAHEVGKERKEAGIFTYDTKELLEKARFLDPYYTPEQQRALMEAGIVGRAPVAPGTLEPGSINDPAAESNRVRRAAQLVQNMKDATNMVDEEAVNKLYHLSDRRLQELIADDAVAIDSPWIQEIYSIRSQAEQAINAARIRGGEDEIIRSLSLQNIFPEDVALLKADNGKGAQQWLLSKLDLLYETSAAGQELDSQVMADLQRQIGGALAYINYHFKGRRDISQEFINNFTHRQKLMIMRVVIGGRDPKPLRGAGQQLGMDGLLSSFAFEDQNVRRVFLRMNEKLDDMRTNVREAGFTKKVSAEMVARMRRQIEDDEFELFRRMRENSPYWHLASNGAVIDRETYGQNDNLEAARLRAARNAIRRAERTAYDLFVATQREAIIVGRGKQPIDQTEGYNSVPSGLFSFFNPEAMMWGGWEMRNGDAAKFFDALKKNIANDALEERGINPKHVHDVDKIEYGSMLIRELSPIADVFSGGWRRTPIMQQMEHLMLFKSMAAPRIEQWRAQVQQNHPTLSLTRENIKDLLNGRQTILGQDAAGNDVIFNPQNDIQALRDEFKAAYTEVYDIREAIKRHEINHATGKPYTLEDSQHYDSMVRAKDFGLFMQLRGEADDHNAIRQGKTREAAKRVWGKIAQSKPEEIIKFLKDKLPVRREGLRWNNELESLERDIQRIMGPEWQNNPAMNNAIKTGDGETAFNRFKTEFGGVISIIRDNGMKEDIPRVANLANLQPHERIVVDSALGNGAAEKLMKVYQAMQRYIDRHHIKDALTGNNEKVLDLLVKDYRFEDLYTRVLALDDVMMDEVEELPQIMVDAGVIKVSRQISPDRAGDGYRRTMNDTEDGINANSAFYNFVKEESMKTKEEKSMEYAEYLGSANGQATIAKALRYTMGSYLVMQRPDYWWDMMGIRKLPFRIPVSESQRIYGPEGHVMEREEVRKYIDEHLRNKLSESTQHAELKLREEYERGLITAEHFAHEVHELRHHSEAMYNSLRRSAGVLTRHEARDTTVKLGLFLLLWIIGESIKTVEGATKDLTGGK